MPIVALCLALFSAEPEPITVVGNAWAPFISPMGEPFRSRTAGDDTMARWFNGADGDGSGAVSQSEMEVDALRFFRLLDTDGNGEILPEEQVAYETQIAPEIQVNARWRDPRGEGRSTRSGGPRNGYDPRGLQGAARYALLNIPQPVASADTDFDRAVTIDEFRKAATERFRLLDRNSDDRLDLDELRAQLPPTRKDQKRAKEDAPDVRLGTPVKIAD
ncbi:MAG TPA: EF-hand domain-containing protein [Sphingomicrobium sp.]